MENWSKNLTTRTGFHFHVRPAQPADEPALAEFFTHVTREDLRFRFLAGLKEVGHDRIAALAEVDHKLVENFLAFDEAGTMIATGMIACGPDDPSRAEVAITTREDYKHRGVSWELLAHIVHFAEVKSIKTLESLESRQNHAAIELEREMGFTAETDPDDPTLLVVRKTLGEH
jgi:GNAT superfamily N-acetyltransferase